MEAAYIVPVVFMCMFIPIWIGIQSHQQIIQWVEQQMKVETIDTILAIYRQDYMKDMGINQNED